MRTPGLRSLVAAAVIALPLLASAQDSTAKAPPPPPPATYPPAGPQLDFSGWLFGSYSYHTDPGTNLQNRFAVDRAYLTFKMSAGERVSVRITTDIYGIADSSRALRAKYAYLQYNYLTKGDNMLGGTTAWARVGELHTVFIDYEENFWPRYLTNTGVEKFGFFSSADFGAATGVTLPNKWGEIYATITDGPGYNKGEADRFKDYAARLTLTPLANSSLGLLKSLSLSGWYYKGTVASKFLVPDTINTVAVTSAVDHSRFGLFAGLKDRRLTAGLDYAQTTNDVESAHSNPANPYSITGSVTGKLLSVYGVVRPLEWIRPDSKSRLGLVGRFDSWKPNSDLNPKQRFIVGGVLWDLSAKATLALDYQELLGRDGDPTKPSSVLFAHYNVTF